MTDRFAGAWHVREHVFGSDARCLGVVAQRRRLVEDRVLQDNEPEPALAEHPIAAFAGHHEFALSRDGRRRRYLGPAVIGSGLEVADGVMVSTGLWPALGWSFAGWSIMTAPTRQLTGGWFRRATAPVATIVGVATPDTADRASLDLAGPMQPAATLWIGERRRVDLDGVTLATDAIARRYHDAGWSDPAEAIELAGSAGALVAKGHCDGAACVGAGRRLGPTVELELWLGSDLAITMLDVLDVATSTLTCLRWRHHRGRLDTIDVIRLRPEGAPP